MLDQRSPKEGLCDAAMTPQRRNKLTPWCDPGFLGLKCLNLRWSCGKIDHHSMSRLKALFGFELLDRTYLILYCTGFICSFIYKFGLNNPLMEMLLWRKETRICQNAPYTIKQYLKMTKYGPPKLLSFFHAIPQYADKGKHTSKIIIYVVFLSVLSFTSVAL